MTMAAGSLHVGPDPPIFILGVTPRSGTNFLMDLLLLHPMCARGRAPVNEDFFLENADVLVEFVTRVTESWDRMWGEVTPDVLLAFERGLGEGLISFLGADPHRRLVTKTPSVRNLELFSTFFPTAKLLILMRDGRSVVQSCIDSFGWEFDRAARMWRAGARAIARFQSAATSPEDFRVVRYEDLIDDLRPNLTEILSFVGLDPGPYDLDRAERLPVRGSSFFHGPGRSDVHWDPVEKDAGFDPVERWHGWREDRQARFDWIAGPELDLFGYPRRDRSWDVRDVLRHRALDSRWRSRVAARRAMYRARGSLGPLTRPLREKLGLTRDP